MFSVPIFALRYKPGAYRKPILLCTTLTLKALLQHRKEMFTRVVQSILLQLASTKTQRSKLLHFRATSLGHHISTWGHTTISYRTNYDGRRLSTVSVISELNVIHCIFQVQRELICAPPSGCKKCFIPFDFHFEDKESPTHSRRFKGQGGAR